MSLESTRAWREDVLVVRNRAIAHLGSHCARCANTENLVIDHIDPKKKSFELSSAGIRSWHKWEEILEELKVCQLLCSRCHGKKSSRESPDFKPAQHGTPSKYSYGRCRCAECRKAHALYNRNYYRKKYGKRDNYDS